MAIANVNVNRGFLATLTGGTNPVIDLPAGASIGIGNVLIMIAAYDNSGTAGVDPNMSVVNSPFFLVHGRDLRDNLWFRIAKAVRTSGGANDGTVVDIWMAYVTHAYSNGDDITLNFSFPAVVTLAQISEWSGVNSLSYSVVTATTGTGNGTSITAPAIAPTTTGQMVVAVAGIETNTAITGDADTTNGSWVALANLPGNTGVDATSQVAFSQYKIVTAPGAQNWTATKVGASDWAALAVVFEAFTSVAPGYSSGNPNYPCIAGAEILPLGADYLPIDTGTEYFQTHMIFPNSYGSQSYMASAEVEFNPSGSGASYAHHTTIHEVFQSGAEVVSDEIVTRLMPIRNATTGGGATVSSGSAIDALSAVGGAYVVLPNAGYVDMYFDPTVNLVGSYDTYRVVRWGVRYMAWKDDSASPGPGEGLIAEWRDTGANNGAGAAATISAWLVQNYKRDAQYQTRYLGETNPIIRGKGEILPQNAPYNAAFTVNDLSHMASGDETTKFRFYGAQGGDATQATVYLDYIEAFVEVVPERRLAHGTRLISNAPTFASTFYYTNPFGDTQMWSALNTNNRWQVPTSTGPYVLGTREAMPASPGDYFASQSFTASGAVGRTIGYNEAIGPSWLLHAIEQPRATLENAALTGQPVLQEGIINGGVLAAPPKDLDNFILSVAAMDAVRIPLDGSFYPAYQNGGDLGTFNQVYTGFTPTAAVLVDGTTTFDRVKVLVFPDELTTANLTITIEQPSLTVLATATITVAQALAFPDLGNGWREISAALNVSVTPAVGTVIIRFASTTPNTAPWRYAGGFPINGDVRYTYNPLSFTRNKAAVLQCLLAAPSVGLGTAVQNLYRPDGRCLSAAISLPTITLTNGATYDWISIERSTDAGVTYTPVVLLEDPTNGQIYTDSAVPWDQPALSITYRVTGFRNADHLSDVTVTAGWNAVATAPGTGGVFGLAAPNGTLYAYVPTSENALEVQWNPLNPVEIVPLLGVDYQIPLRAPEERGLEVSFLVIVDQIVACGVIDAVPWDETLPSEGALSPAPFDQLRAIAKTTRFSLLLPGGHSRFVTLVLGGMTIKTGKSLYLAEVRLVDTIPEPIEPYEADTT